MKRRSGRNHSFIDSYAVPCAVLLNIINFAISCALVSPGMHKTFFILIFSIMEIYGTKSFKNKHKKFRAIQLSSELLQIGYESYQRSEFELKVIF